MKKIMIACSLLFLAGCSEEVEQQNEENIADNRVEESANISPASEQNVQNETSQEQENEALNNEETQTVENNTTNNLQETEEKVITENNDGSSKELQEIGDIKADDLFVHYSTMDDTEAEEIEFITIDEGTIELPLFEKNEEVFEESLVTVTLNEFKNNEIEYYEEPISSGYLIAVNLSDLGEENSGQSYSLMYNEIEYAFFITEEEPDVALAVIDNVTLEEAKSAQLLIMK